MDICSNVCTLIFRISFKKNPMYKNRQYKKHIITFLLSLRFISLLASCSSSSFFSVLEEIKRSEYLIIITAHTVFLFVEIFRT